MLDVAVSYHRYQFIGYEFLTWLWFVIENQQAVLNASGDDFVSLEIGNRMVLENNKNNAVEKITIKGDQAGLEEAVLSMQKGAVVTEMHLIYSAGHHEWQFNIKGENLGISGLRTPQTGRIETKTDIEGVVLERIFLYEKATNFIHYLYKTFISVRVTDQWDRNIVPLIRKWIMTPS